MRRVLFFLRHFLNSFLHIQSIHSCSLSLSSRRAPNDENHMTNSSPPKRRKIHSERHPRNSRSKYQRTRRSRRIGSFRHRECLRLSSASDRRVTDFHKTSPSSFERPRTESPPISNSFSRTPWHTHFGCRLSHCGDSLS